MGEGDGCFVFFWRNGFFAGGFAEMGGGMLGGLLQSEGARFLCRAGRACFRLREVEASWEFYASWFCVP